MTLSLILMYIQYRIPGSCPRFERGDSAERTGQDRIVSSETEFCEERDSPGEGDYPGLDKDRTKPLRWLRQGGIALILIFHLGVVFGHNEVHAFVVQHPEKSGMSRYSVAVPVAELSHRTDLEARPYTFENSLVGAGGNLCGDGENVSLPADKSH